LIFGFACHYSLPIFFWLDKLSSFLSNGFSFLGTPPAYLFDESTSESVATSKESTTDQVATTESELVHKLQARILQAIADKSPAAAHEVYCQVHELGVKEAVKAVLTNIENEDFRRLVKLWKETKTQP
jgi:hypothetical protein